MLSSNCYTYNSRNQKSVLTFIDKLFERHAKLLPVRLDLGYKSNELVSQMTGALFDTSVPHSYLTLHNILMNWEAFLNRLRWNHSRLLKELVGYVWKIEYGLDKGIHYHLMLLFNGNRVQKDYYYANELGELWLEITNNQGVYFNCSVDKQERYGNNNCLQVIHRNDDRANLYRAMQYFTKIDDNNDMAKFLSGGRVFGKSHI